MKKTSAILAVVFLCVATVASGSPAGAARSSPSRGCDILNNNVGLDGTYQNATLPLSTRPMAAGETIVVAASNPTVAHDVLYFEIDDGGTTLARVTSGVPGSLRYTLTQDLDGPQMSLTWGVSSSSSPSRGGDADWNIFCIPVIPEVADLPSPLLQQIMRNADDDCANVDESALTWGSQLKGGWSTSWAEWPHDGKGGPVCTRTIHHDQANRAWG